MVRRIPVRLAEQRRQCRWNKGAEFMLAWLEEDESEAQENLGRSESRRVAGRVRKSGVHWDFDF